MSKKTLGSHPSPEAPPEELVRDAKEARMRHDSAGADSPGRGVPAHVHDATRHARGSGDDTPSRDLDKVIVRLPDGMRDALKAVAAANNRSMNAEIVARLQDSMEWPRLVATAEASFASVGEALHTAETLVSQAVDLAEHYKTQAETATAKIEDMQAKLVRLRNVNREPG